MSNPSSELSAKLSAYEAERTERLLYRMRGQDPGPPTREQRLRVAWLLGDGAAEAYQEASGKGLLSDREQGALVAHLALLSARSVVVEPQSALRDALVEPLPGRDGDGPLALLWSTARTDGGRPRAALGRQALGALEDRLIRLAEAYEEAQERFPSAFPPAGKSLQREAERVLADTTEATREHVRRLVRPWERGSQVPWHALCRGVRAQELDPHCQPRERFRRAASTLRELGFERHLGRAVRVERAPLAIPQSQLVVRSVPGDIRLFHPEAAGLLFELSAYEGLGRAFGISLVSASLPWPLAYPVASGPASVLGGLLLGWAVDPGYLGKMRAMAGESRDRYARTAAVTLALLIRLAAVRVIGGEEGRTLRERLEWRAQRLSLALCCDVPPGLAGLLWTGHRNHVADAEGRVLGLAMHVALRDQFDEDCFRNPRTSDCLREFGELGGLRDVHDYVTSLGAVEGAASARLLELLA